MQAVLFADLQPLVARRPNLALLVLMERSVYGVELLRYVFDTIELGGFSECQQVAESLGALDALF